MQFAATYPLAQIRRVQIYNNIKRYRETELDKILQETGGSFVVRRADLPQRPVRLLPPEGRRRGVRRAGLPCVGHGHGAPTCRTMPWSGCCGRTSYVECVASSWR